MYMYTKHNVENKTPTSMVSSGQTTTQQIDSCKQEVDKMHNCWHMPLMEGLK